MKKKKTRRGTKAGREIISGLTELVEAVARGDDLSKRFTVRTVELPDGPSVYDAARIKKTRELLGASQAIFAHLIGVSAALVRSWEQGIREPATIACRLLDEINREPDRWRRMLQSHGDGLQRAG
jgi:DNA-binding transcriptional regulator YiaG